MKIAVCIKQVPASSDVKVDPETGVLIRSDSNTKMNPYDLFAVEAALKIKETVEGATVTAICMGPDSAKKTLQEALWMGCDDAVLLSDRKFAGADVLATSQALSQGLLELGKLDLIICGKQTTDGDTAQVGPEIAELLNYPQAPYVDEIVEVKDQSIVVRSNFDTYYDVVEVQFPCLLTVEKDIFTPRLPSYKRGKQFTDYEIKVLTVKDLPVNDEKIYGLNGSPTQVEKIFSPEQNTDKVLVEGSSTELSDRLYDELKSLKFI